MAKRGRPPKFVKDPNGHPIVGLSYNKDIGYYATYSKPRKSFGTDLSSALFKYRQYRNEQNNENHAVEIRIPDSKDFINKTGEYIDWKNFPDDPPVIPVAYEGETAYIPEILFIQKARELILTDPITSAKKLGIPELARLDDLPRLEKPLSLQQILEFYLETRNPCKEEQKKVKSIWKGFCKSVKVRTVREITCDMIHDYKDKLCKICKSKGYKTSWLRRKFTRVKTVLNCSKKYGRTNKRELVRVLQWCECLSAPNTIDVSAKPIEREDVNKLLNVADVKWRAVILLALNCGYYAKDIHDLKKNMIKKKNELDYIIFPREKNKHMRINVLWKETKQALDQYMEEKPNDLEYVFLSMNKTPWDTHDIMRGLGTLRKKSGVSDEVKFSHFRDGAASALFGLVQSDKISVTIGHRIKGEKSKYISVKPEQVKDCADYIWKEYFG